MLVDSGAERCVCPPFWARDAPHVTQLNPCLVTASGEPLDRAFWKLMNPQECVWEIRYPHHHQDRIAGKGENSSQHYILIHKFTPMPQDMKIPAAKAAVDKEWEKLEKFSSWNLQFILHINGHMSFEKC